MKAAKLRGAALAIVMLVSASATVLSADMPKISPTALWSIVHGKCVPSQTTEGRPGECQLVDLDGRYAVLKDMHGNTRFLLIPTDPVSGIESPVLLQSDTPNYWQAAWSARKYVAERAGHGIPDDRLGLAVNSVFRRSQNQLHIHIDCINPGLQAALAAHEGEIATTWPAKPLQLAARNYYVLKIQGSEVGVDPFLRLAARLQHPANEMGGHNLALLGAHFRDGTTGFYLLDSPAGLRGATSDDELDRDCKVLRTD